MKRILIPICAAVAALGVTAVTTLDLVLTVVKNFLVKCQERR